jgi:metal-sulfur cluster biosynthetic enzyme
VTSQLVTEQTVRGALREVVDPELGVNVVDLGLIYGITTDGGHVRVAMTLTTPGCPLHASMSQAAEAMIWAMVPGVQDVSVELVWDPPWSPDHITAAGRLALGWAGTE